MLRAVIAPRACGNMRLIADGAIGVAAFGAVELHVFVNGKAADDGALIGAEQLTEVVIADRVVQQHRDLARGESLTALVPFFVIGLIGGIVPIIFTVGGVAVDHLIYRERCANDVSRVWIVLMIRNHTVEDTVFQYAAASKTHKAANNR